MVYYINKKRFIFPIILCVILLVIGYWSIDYVFTTDFFKSNNSSDEIAILFIFGFTVGIGGIIGTIVCLYYLLRNKKEGLRLNEQGVIINLSKAYKKAGLIGWNEILKIERSTDNMNKPAIRITLKDHKNGEYLFYIPCKKLGVKQADLLASFMQYYKPEQM